MSGLNAKIELRTIEAPEAEVLLENVFEGQRPRRESRVLAMAQDMRLGRWKLAPDCILIVKGKLANGQHRLAAVVESGTACRFIVMESNDDELYQVIDGVLPRTASDVIAGEHAAHVASIARNTVMYDKNCLTRLGWSKRTGTGEERRAIFTRADVVEYALEHHEELKEAAVKTQSLYRQKSIVPRSIGGTVLHLASRRHPKEANAFLDAIYLGTSRDDAAHDLRERFIKNSVSAAKLPPAYLLALTIKAFNSYVNGTRPGVLKLLDGEDYPRIK